ncbi:hypothetical protein [Dapis sp. BLCC M126]
MNNILNLPVVIGLIFFRLGLLPITKVSIRGAEVFLGKPINVWQRFIFI